MGMTNIRHPETKDITSNQTPPIDKAGKSSEQKEQ
jgi:hypothetical protein